MDKIRLLEIILRNKGKDFINRIVNANDFPTLENRDGTISTHSMTYAEVDGRFYVYPTVVYQDGKLMRLGPDTAFNHALTSGEYVTFDDEREAMDFSKEYKQLMPFFESAQSNEIWKDLETGPGASSDDSMTGVSDGN